MADPCDLQYIDDNPNRAANCAADGVPPDFVNEIANRQTIGFQTGGNPLLVEEEGESSRLAPAMRPRFLPGLSIAIDYYDIEVTDLISPPDAQAILNACYDSPTGIVDNPYCDAINPALRMACSVP